MFAIKTWCLDPKTPQDVLRAIHQGFVSAVVSFEALRVVGLKDEDSMLVLFPPDLMEYGVGTEILVEATDLDESVDLKVRNDLAAKLGMVINTYFSEAKISCKVRPRDRQDGTWEL